PENLRQIREFTGLCNYFRQSVPNFSFHAQHLTKLLKKDSKWRGGHLPPESLKAFQHLQQALANPPTLAFPDPNKKYFLLVDVATGSTDTPGGLGACLVQFHDDIPRPVAYASRALQKHEKNYTAYLLELTACVFGVTHFDTYLRGNHFTLYTDHKPLEKLSSTHTKTFNRLQQLMLDYSFTIKHHPGKDNTAPDFLSRNPVASVSISYDNLVYHQQQDQQAQNLYNKSPDKYTKHNGLIFYKESKHHSKRIFLPAKYRPDIIQAMHCSLLGGHMGVFKSFNRIANRYYWPNMRKDIQDHLRACDICQKASKINHPQKAPLQPLPQPASINHRIHTDLFGPLQSSGNKNKYVLVITDAFSKYCELVALPNKEATTVAEAIFDTWITRYGIPENITTDGGKEFCNRLLEKLCSRLAIVHRTTSPYHPQANASAETFNRTMKKYLSCFSQPPYLDWEPYLACLRFCYNTSISKATHASPFSLVFGMDPSIKFFELERYVDYDETSANVDQLRRLFTARQLAKQNNIEYKNKYKQQFDKKAAMTKIKQGDFVYLVKQPDQRYKNPKLHPVYSGPYEVLWLSDKNAELQLPTRKALVSIDNIKLATTLPAEPTHQASMPVPHKSTASHPSDDDSEDESTLHDNHSHPGASSSEGENS
ncbi:MAG: RNase H-like domain-containing protein, partial [Myxococcota bacterium]